MSVAFENKEFKRIGRKTEGEDENAKYTARQLTSDSISVASAEDYATDCLEVAGGDWAKAREYFIAGANHGLRLEAGGYTPEEKAAKALIKSLPQFAGMDLATVVALVNTMKASAGK